MAKIAFNKLGLVKNQDNKIIIFNDNEIEVKQYLPVEEKLNLISDVLNLSFDENNFSNPIKLKTYFTLEVLFYYTNISFTEKQKENIVKLYDQIESNGLFDLIVKNIPEKEYNDLYSSLIKINENIYKQRNSFLGMMDSISKDYSNLDLDASKIQKELGDPKNMELLKTVLTKLG